MKFLKETTLVSKVLKVAKHLFASSFSKIFYKNRIKDFVIL